MKFSNRIRIIFVFADSLFLLSACSREPKSLLAFFYLELCPGCDSYIRADQIKAEMLGMSKKYLIKTVNLVTEENFRELKAVIEQQKLPDISRSLPLLVFKGQYVNGYDSIETKLHEIGEAR